MVDPSVSLRSSSIGLSSTTLCGLDGSAARGLDPRFSARRIRASPMQRRIVRITGASSGGQCGLAGMGAVSGLGAMDQPSTL